MKIVGLMLARDEAWCVGLTLPVALSWCDEVVVLDHKSRDATPELVADAAREHPGRVHLVREREAPFHEAAMRQRTLDVARSRGATHCAIIDADEALTANLVPHAREMVAAVGAGDSPAIPMRSPFEGLDRHRVGPRYARQWIPVWFRDDPSLSFAAERDGYHYHARMPVGLRRTYFEALRFGGGGAWHLQSITQRRLAVKSACYKALERAHFPGKRTLEELDAMYDWAVTDPVVTEPAPEHWHAGYAALASRLDLSAEPWQLAELRRLLETNPPETFAGLRLHGVA